MAWESGLVVIAVVTNPNEQGEGVVEVAEFDCLSSAVPGDLVRLDQVHLNFVTVAVNNLESNPVVGRILRKTTPTHCVVVIRGVMTAPVIPIGKVFLSTTGTFTDTPPPLNYLQTIGYSFGNGKIHLEPNINVTYRPPV